MRAIKGISIFPPTRKLEKDDILSAFENSNGDSLIVVALKIGNTDKQHYKVKVIDLDAGQVAWIGSSQTNAIDKGFTEGMGLSAMFRSLASGVVSRFLSDQMYTQANVQK